MNSSTCLRFIFAGVTWALFGRIENIMGYQIS
jgi:hypothetical protein